MLHHGHIHLLLIDESATSAELIRNQTEQPSAGKFHVQWYRTLSAAFDQPPPEESVVVLLSLTLPDIRGNEALVAVRRRLPKAAVVAIAGDSSDQAAMQSLASGADDYLVRGEFNQDALLRAIQFAVQRNQANIAIKRERYLLRMLIDDLPDHIYAKDLQGHFLVVNRAIQQFFGLDSDDKIIGKTDFDLLPYDAAMDFQNEERELTQSKKTAIDRESHITSRAATPGSLWIRTTKVPMRDEFGRIVGIVGINRDITERRQFREALEQSNAELAERQRALMATMAALERSHEELREAQLRLVQADKMESIGRLAAGVAHEIKNPLSVALMCAEYLTRLKLQNPKVAPVLSTLADAIHRADSVVHGLLDFATPGAVALTDASLDHVVRRSLTLVRHELLRSHVSVRNELPCSMPPLRLDIAKVEQVLINVFMNAIHAMPQGGTIRISCSESRQCGSQCDGSVNQSDTDEKDIVRTLMLYIDDTGTGIAETHIKKVFEPFFTTQPVGKGSGLGLTVSETIMKLHGGSISLANRPEGGARVALLFQAKGA